MVLLELTHLALRNLRTYKLRSGLSILGIMIGVAAVVAIVAILEGATAAVQSQFLEFLNPRVIMVERSAFYEPNASELRSSGLMSREYVEERIRAYDKARKLFTIEFARELQERVSVLRRVVPTVTMQVLLRRKSQIGYAQAIGTTPEYTDLADLKLIQGRFLRWEDLERDRAVIVLNEEVAQMLFPRQDPLGQRVDVQISTREEASSVEQAQAFTVVGIVHPARQGQLHVYLPVVMLQSTVMRQGLRYWAEAARPEWVEEAARQVRFILMRRLGVSVGAIEGWVRTPRQELESYQEITRILMAVLGGIAAISLLVGGIGIMNIMLVSVTERTREIGILKAVGAQQQDIFVQFLTESALMSLTGGVLGLIGGWMLAYVGSWIGEWVFVISPLPAIVAIGFSMAVGLFFGIHPALKAARLEPVEALRYE